MQAPFQNEFLLSLFLILCKASDARTKTRAFSENQVKGARAGCGAGAKAELAGPQMPTALRLRNLTLIQSEAELIENWASMHSFIYSFILPINDTVLFSKVGEICESEIM